MTQSEQAEARRIRMAVRSGYDQRASEYGASAVRRHRAPPLQIPDIVPGARALDVGCGTGRSTQPLVATATGTVVGVDLSFGMLSRAVKTFDHERHVRFTQGDAERLPFPDGSFDVVFSYRALSHLSDQCQAFREMARVLTSGGVIDVSLFGDRAMGRPIERILRDAVRAELGADAASLLRMFRPPTIAAVDAAAHAAGLVAEDVSGQTTYEWGDPEQLITGLFVATTYMWNGIDASRVDRIRAGALNRARAEASDRGLADWTYSVHYRGRKPIE